MKYPCKVWAISTHTATKQSTGHFHDSHDDVIKWKHFPRHWPLCGEFTFTGEFPAQRPVTRRFDVFFDLRLNKRLSKQSWGWWFETPWCSLWRHGNVESIDWSVVWSNLWRHDGEEICLQSLLLSIVRYSIHLSQVWEYMASEILSHLASNHQVNWCLESPTFYEYSDALSTACSQIRVNDNMMRYLNLRQGFILSVSNSSGNFINVNIYIHNNNVRFGCYSVLLWHNCKLHCKVLFDCGSFNTIYVKSNFEICRRPLDNWIVIHYLGLFTLIIREKRCSTWGWQIFKLIILNP